MSDRSDLDLYDRFISLTPLEIPKRSRLFSLEPIGMGTAATESLSSYLTRLAQEHCLTPQKLIMGEIAPQILGQNYDRALIYKNVSTIFGNSDAKPAINGMRDMTRSLVLALENLTLRQDLKFLSCLTWKGIIKERGLFRQNKAWCPQCFERWRTDKKPIYEPLLWSFRNVDLCLEHDCQLCDRCPHCNSSLKAIGNTMQLGFCDRCQGWLGNEQEKASDLNQDSFINIKGIGDLISVAPNLIFPPSLPDLIKKLQLIHFCFQRAIEQDLTQLIALGKIMEQLKITLTNHYDKPLNLIKLLVPVCDLAKISIAQLLNENFPALSAILLGNLKINYQF